METILLANVFACNQPAAYRGRSCNPTLPYGNGRHPNVTAFGALLKFSVLAASAPEDPEQDRQYHGDDDARHDGEMEAKSVPDYMNVTRQAAKWKP